VSGEANGGIGPLFLDPREVAAAKDPSLVVFVADDCTLMLDLDSAEEEEEFRRRIEMAIELYDRVDAPHPWVGPMLRTTSRGGKGAHVYVHLKDPTPILDRIAMQSALGSDSKRDLLSYLSAELNGYQPLHYRRTPIVLFEVPTEAERVQTWFDLWKPCVPALPLAPEPKLLTDGFVAPGYHVGATDVVVLDE
jgi:hypothetical protein